jgi:hypothetical protein
MPGVVEEIHRAQALMQSIAQAFMPGFKRKGYSPRPSLGLTKVIPARGGERQMHIENRISDFYFNH